MASLDGIAAPIALCVAIGGVLDFYLGKAGQKRIRDVLTTWWLKLSYVNIHNLPQSEARSALKVISIDFWSARNLPFDLYFRPRYIFCDMFIYSIYCRMA